MHTKLSPARRVNLELGRVRGAGGRGEYGCIGFFALILLSIISSRLTSIFARCTFPDKNKALLIVL